MLIIFLFCFKFYIYRCNFQQTSPDFQAFMNLVQLKFNTEYQVAEGKGKLGNHFKKFSFIMIDKLIHFSLFLLVCIFYLVLHCNISYLFLFIFHIFDQCTVLWLHVLLIKPCVFAYMYCDMGKLLLFCVCLTCWGCGGCGWGCVGVGVW